MLSYQHIYHAGCLADVHKHMALAVLLEGMSSRYKPMTYIETHAGRGLYDLNSAEARKTQEAKAGIIHLMEEEALPDGHPYLRVVKTIQKEYGSSHYPGSPMLAKYIMRLTDDMHFFELHPREHAALDRSMRGRNIQVYRQDGYEGALSLPAPATRRGVVLVDPSYEIKSEYQEAAEFVVRLHAKWPEAVIMMWYPLLAAGLHSELCEVIQAAGLPNQWLQEVTFAAPDSGRMYGSGLLCLNVPTHLKSGLEDVATLYK